jgi:hypothetical protein
MSEPLPMMMTTKKRVSQKEITIGNVRIEMWQRRRHIAKVQSVQNPQIQA